jgi:ADP-dependent phosphofructokinase/glucokinase
VNEQAGATEAQEEETWRTLYEHTRTRLPECVFVGFNASIDRIIKVEELPPGAFSFPGGDLLRTRLEQSIERRAAEEWFVEDPAFYQRAVAAFAARGHSVIGGQAGIAAVHLAGMGVPDVRCYVPGICRECAAMLESRGIVPLDGSDPPPCDARHTHLVFEYGGEEQRPDTATRANRFIASPMAHPGKPLFAAHALTRLPSLLSSCTRGFLSGYQYLATIEEFREAKAQLRAMHRASPSFRSHVECVTIDHEEILAMLTRWVLTEADSVGCNEQELGLILESLGEEPRFPRGEGHRPGPSGLVEGALTVHRRLGVQRLHLHTYGISVLVHASPVRDPEGSRGALITAARAACDRAGGDRTALLPEIGGILREAARSLSPPVMPGVYREGDTLVMIVPALLSVPVRKTAGLGDTISSTAFVCDPF